MGMNGKSFMQTAGTNLDLKSLQQLLGAENVVLDENERVFFSQDIWIKGKTADVVVSPLNTEELVQTVKLISNAGLTINPRGGGMSYTGGFTPTKSNSAILDLSKMNKILEINTEDMYVTVEAGCTWQTLHEALKPLGVRTPFWGPLSGISSTIGGGLSQNNAFFGAGTQGPSTDSVTSLAVVLADGSLVKTGSAGADGGKPFFRQYGPDLTGLFLADAGAFGYKAEATLRLIKTPRAEDWASYNFEMLEDWSAFMAEAGRMGLACELIGFDPNLQRVRMERASLMSDVSTLKNVITGQKNLLKGLKEGAKVAIAGRGYMEEVAYSAHMVVEGHSEAEVAAKMATLAELAHQNNGLKIENSIPKILRSTPFTPLNNILGPKGERWVPVHGIVAMSDGPKCLADIEELFEQNKQELDQFGVLTGYLLTTLSNNGYLIEPVFLWPEEINEIHRRTVEAHVLSKTEKFEPNPDATAFVGSLRQKVINIFVKYNGVHFQIGRTYPYRSTRADATGKLVDGIKTLVDEKGVVNPGALGLG